MAERKTSASSKQSNIPMVQNTLLIWLDSTINEEDDDYSNAISKFERVVNSIKHFTDTNKCIQCIQNLKNEKVYMVVSGSVGQQVMPFIHDLSQIDSIFVFCGNKSYHENWVKNWPKIKGVYTGIAPICKALKQSVEPPEQSTIAMDSMREHDRHFNQLDASFMYTQILKEILLSIRFKQEYVQKFIAFCHEQFADNHTELKNIEVFEREYTHEGAIQWYIQPSFLAPMVDRALRTMDMDILIKAGFFICDLHQKIEQLSEHHSDKPFTVYRGQGVPKADFEQMSKMEGGLLAFNNFLLTSTDRETSFKFARQTSTKSDFVGVLFVMTVDPSKPTVPFASDAHSGVLFSTHTVFRMGKIKSIDDEHRLFEVELKLTNETDDNLAMLTDHLRKEISRHENGWYQLGSLLYKMGQIMSAQHIYEALLAEKPKESDQEEIFHQLGSIKDDQGEYKEAIDYFNRALAIGSKIRPPTDSHLASSFIKIGSVYEKTEDYSKALESYHKALEIYEKTRPPNHPDLVTSYNSMGSVYNQLEDYPKARSFYEKALAIQERTLPPTHPDLASSYNDIGFVFKNLGDFSQAISFLDRAVKISEKSLPSDHSTLKKYKDNLNAARKESE